MALYPPPSSMPKRPYPLGTAIPTVYDGSWRSYTDLTKDQIAAFQAFPQDLLKYNAGQRWLYEIRAFPSTMVPQPNPYILVNGIPIFTSPPSNVAWINGLATDAQNNPGKTFNYTAQSVVYVLTSDQAIGLFAGLRAYIQQCRDIEASNINGINAGTITLQSQIDQAFAVLQ